MCVLTVHVSVCEREASWEDAEAGGWLRGNLMAPEVGPQVGG